MAKRKANNGYDKLVNQCIEVPHTQSDGEYEVGTKRERLARALYWNSHEHPLHMILRKAGKIIRDADPKTMSKLSVIKASATKFNR